MTAGEGPAIATTAGRSFAERHDQVAELQASDVKEAGRLDFFLILAHQDHMRFCRTLERPLVAWARDCSSRARCIHAVSSLDGSV
jgi:hypothetical protein